MKGEFDRKGFCRRLAQAWYRSGLTNTELEEKTGITRDRMRRYLKGDVLPDIESMIKLAEVLSVSPEWMLTGEGRAPEWI